MGKLRRAPGRAGVLGTPEGPGRFALSVVSGQLSVAWNRGLGPMAEAPPLKHGPYRAPDCRPGDRLVCRMAGEQTVLGFTAAPVPWPYFRGHTSALQLFCCGDLERAFRIETFAAMKHHFRMSKGVVTRWRSTIPREPGSAIGGARSPRLSDEQVASIRARYAAGETMISLAREHDTGEKAIWNYVHHYSRRGAV